MSKKIIIGVALIISVSFGLILGVVLCMKVMEDKVDFHSKESIRILDELSERSFHEEEWVAARFISKELIDILDKNLSEGWYSEWMPEYEMRFLLCIQHVQLAKIFLREGKDDTASRHIDKAREQAKILFEREITEEELFELLGDRKDVR